MQDGSLCLNSSPGDADGEVRGHCGGPPDTFRSFSVWDLGPTLNCSQQRITSPITVIQQHFQ